MALFRMADRTSNITSAAACFEVRTTSTRQVFVREVHISLVTAAATVIGIGKPAAIGVTPTSPKTFLAEDGVTTGVTTSAVAWGTGPTVPANFIERWSFPGTVGAGVIIPFQSLTIGVSSSIILWNILGGATLDVTFVVDE